MSDKLIEQIAEVQARSRYTAYEWSGCDGSRWERLPDHVKSRLIEDELPIAASVVESLGITTEYAACFEDDEQVWLISDRRYLKPEFARDELPSHIQLVKPFVGRSYVSRWERHDG